MSGPMGGRVKTGEVMLPPRVERKRRELGDMVGQAST